MSPHLTNAPQIANRGFMGVDFFFVLSGFLITTLLLRERAETGSFSLRGFYMRRILRILPVYFFVVTMVSAYYILAKGQTEYLQLIPYYYLFLSNFLTEHIPLLDITWSLSVEEQFYLIWPLIMTMLAMRWYWLILAVFIGLNVAAGFGLFGTSDLYLGILYIRLPIATYAPILMGSLLAVLLHNKASFDRLHRALGSQITPLLGLIAVGVAMQFSAEGLSGWPNLAIHTLMTLTLASMVLCPRNLLTPLLENKLIARIGQISYGIYLYHLLALDITIRILSRVGLQDEWTVLLAYSIASVVIAEISFRTLEAYFQRFRPKPAATAPA